MRSIYLTFEAMEKVTRPEGSDPGNFLIPSQAELAWKTGTSFWNQGCLGQLGVTKDYVVGNMVAMADGRKEDQT